MSYSFVFVFVCLCLFDDSRRDGNNRLSSWQFERTRAVVVVVVVVVVAAVVRLAIRPARQKLGRIKH